MEYKIERQQLDKIIDQCSKRMVGECMKRFEIHNNPETIKKEVKELIYENFRVFKELVEKFTLGINFANKNPKQE